MNDRLSDREVQYLLDHLDPLYTGTDLGQYIRRDEGGEQPGVLIPQSDRPLELNEVINIGDIPVLFPCSKHWDWYVSEGKGIRFHHDILKSAFYLLSGYQEVHSPDKDSYGRFPWKSSIQHKLGISGKPVVNYYFNIILEAFQSFCKLNGLEFSRINREAPVLFLSHDVDRLKKYSLRNLAYSALQLLRLRPRSRTFRQQLEDLGMHTRGLLSFRPDPYQTFEELSALEQTLHISSTWFFLEKTKMEDSRYHFRERRIRKLIHELSEKGHEIGIHGSWESSENEQVLKNSLRRLNEVCDTPVTGIRQHFLRHNNPSTPLIQSRSGLIYDASLGFAEQPGFRNSYVFPFRLYDFERKAPMDIWQLPLQVMDATLLEYMGSPAASVTKLIEPVLAEVSRFNGVFSLLWHNCRLDELSDPGINAAYEQMLKRIMQAGYVSLTGQQVLDSWQPGD